MSDRDAMTPDELRDFEKGKLHHEDPVPAGPASESEEAQESDPHPPRLPLPNPD